MLNFIYVPKIHLFYTYRHSTYIDIISIDIYIDISRTQLHRYIDIYIDIIYQQLNYIDILIYRYRYYISRTQLHRHIDIYIYIYTHTYMYQYIYVVEFYIYAVETLDILGGKLLKIKVNDN